VKLVTETHGLESQNKLSFKNEALISNEILKLPVNFRHDLPKSLTSLLQLHYYNIEIIN